MKTNYIQIFSKVKLENDFETIRREKYCAFDLIGIFTYQLRLEVPYHFDLVAFH